MAETFRINIPVNVKDQTNPGLDNASKKVTGFEKQIRTTKKQLDEMNRTRWQLMLSAIDNTSRVVNRVRSTMFGLVGRTWNISIGIIGSPLRMINNIKNSLLSLPTIMAGLATGYAVNQGIINPVKMADELKRAQIGFRTFLGNQAGDAFMGDVREFAINTPFGETETRNMAMQLLPTFKDNPDQIFRTLRAFGDASSLTGAGTEGMKRALLGYRQIAAVGKLTMEELRQVTENLMIPLDPIVEELGIAKSELSDLGRKGIPSAKALDAILRAIERPVNKGGFLGGMSAIMETTLQQTSILKDNLRIRFVERWGKGLESVVLPVLKDMNSWMDKNSDTVDNWGRALETAGKTLGTEVVDGFMWVKSKVTELTTSQAWKDATTFGQKMGVTWDFLETGFQAWWAENQGIMTGTFNNVGGFLGGALKGGIMTALGLIDPTTKVSDEPFVGAGQKAGKAFMDGFMEELDFSEIVNKLGTIVLPSTDKSLGENIFGMGAGVIVGSWLWDKLFKSPFEKGKGLLDWGKKKLFGNRGGGTTKTIPKSGPINTSSPLLGPDGKPLNGYEPKVTNHKTLQPNRGFWGRVKDFFSPTKGLDATVKGQSAKSLFQTPKGLERFMNNIKVPGWLKFGGRWLGPAGLGYSMYDTQQWMNDRGLGGEDLQNKLWNVHDLLFKNQDSKHPLAMLNPPSLEDRDVPIKVQNSNQFTIRVEGAPQISIQAAASASEVQEVLEANSLTWGNIIAERLATKLEEYQNNTP